MNESPRAGKAATLQKGPKTPTVQRMKPILGPTGEWVGPPVLVLKLLILPGEMILDGRRRLAEHKERGLSYEPPRYVARSHMEALKLLIHAGHHQRAADHALVYAPEFVEKTTSYLEHAFELSRHKLIPFVQALQPDQRHKLPRRAMQVVNRVKKLEDKLRTEGRKATIDEVAACLGEFLRDDESDS